MKSEITRSPNGFLPDMELKAKTKQRLDVILTTLPVGENPQVEANNLAERFASSAAMTFMWGNQRIQDGNGFRLMPTDRPNPTIVEAITTYIMRIPTTQIFAICEPGTQLQGNFGELLKQVDLRAMGNAWGAFAYARGASPSEAPEVFVMMAQHLPFVVGEIPRTLRFGDEAWRYWFHTFLTEFIGGVRYIDITGDNVIAPRPTPMPIVEPLPTMILGEVEAEELTPLPEPKKPRKKKKWKKARKSSSASEGSETQ